MAKPTEFDQSAFYAAIDAKRQERGLTWKQMAAESGVGASTLTRMRQGKGPDAKGLASLVAWSGLNLDSFVRSDKKPRQRESDTLALVTAHFHSDPHLTADGAETLSRLVALTYQQIKKPPKKGKG